MNRILALIVLLTLLIASPVLAQQGTLTQQSGTALNTSAFTTTATGAANTAVTVTAPAQGGLSFYLCWVHIVEIANAAVTGAAGPAPIFTTTGLPTNVVWWGDNSTQGIGWQKVVVDSNYAPGCIKAVQAQAVTIVTSAGQSTQNVRINIGGYYAQ